MVQIENIFKGVITALITPFIDDKIDYNALEKLISRQLDANIDGIVIGGSTGEGNCLSDEEIVAIVKKTVQLVGSRTKVTVGIATAGTQEALERIKLVDSLGINGLMLTAPYYVRPNQEGLYQHFKVLHDKTDLPIMLYAHPGRTGVDLSDNTILRLTGLGRIIALKDAASDIERPLRIKKALGDKFNMLTGDDSNYLAFSAHGGSGVVSVTSNILPKAMMRLHGYYQEGKRELAFELQKSLFDIYEAIFSETNPIGPKCAANILGLCNEELRLPLVKATLDTRAKLSAIMPLLEELENGRRI